VLEQAVEHIDGQLALLRKRRDETERLVGELEDKRRRAQDRLRTLRRRGVSSAG
jgi:hypothetical protein